MFPYGRTIWVHSQTGINRYGDYTYDDAGRPVHGCAIAPRASSEQTDRRDLLLIGLVVYAPPDAGITATDVITLDAPDGDRWQVEGEPGLWSDPFTGWTPGQEIQLSRARG